MGIDLYHFPLSPSCRAVVMTATNIGVPLNLKLVNINAGEHLEPEFLKMNPMHTLPTLNDNGFILFESRAIMQYLANAYAKHDSFYPKLTKKRAIVDEMLLFDMGTLYKAFGEAYLPIILENQKSLNPEKIAKLNEALGFLETFLKKTKYAAGDSLNLADFSIMTTLCTTEAVGHDLTKFKLIKDYMRRCKSELKGYDVNENGARLFGEVVKANLAGHSNANDGKYSSTMRQQKHQSQQSQHQARF